MLRSCPRGRRLRIHRFKESVEGINLILVFAGVMLLQRVCQETCSLNAVVICLGW